MLCNLRRRKAVELELRILCVQRPQQILVPLDIKIRMQPALHQNARAAEGDRLVDPFADLLDRMDVCVRLARPPVERTERADDVADVRIIDVTVDDVGDDVGRILPPCGSRPRQLRCVRNPSIRATRCSLRQQALACRAPCRGSAGYAFPFATILSKVANAIRFRTFAKFSQKWVLTYSDIS